MRYLVLISFFLCFLALTWTATVKQLEAESADEVYDVPQGSENVRKARQFYGGYYGRPYYGGYYGSPYGGYYGRPYGGYYGRPYGGYYGRPYGGYLGYPGFGGGFFG